MSSDMEGKMQDRYDALPSLEAEATAFRRGAEAMRELAAEDVERRYVDYAQDMAADIRAVPIPVMEPNT